MRKHLASWTVLVWTSLLLPVPRAPGTHAADVGGGAKVAVGASGPSDFHLALCEHHHVHHDVVLVVHRRGIPDEHIPVVFLLAERCRVTPDVIVDLRVKGKSWMDIALHFGHHAEIFHVESSRDHGPPYGRALGHFKRPRAEWGALRLVDDDVVALVNVKLIAAHHGLSADDVLALRQKDDDFVKLQGRAKTDRALSAARKADAAAPPANGKVARHKGFAPLSTEAGPKGNGGGKGSGNPGRGKGK
jgi:hypothetical protein